MLISFIVISHTSWSDGEFGPVYQTAEDGVDNWEKINESRYAVLEYQLGMYDRAQASWSIWTYKDIGFQGMTYVDPSSTYIQLVKPFLKKKKALACDAWGCDQTPVQHLFEPIVKWIEENAPHVHERYPKTWARGGRHVGRMVRDILLSVSGLFFQPRLTREFPITDAVFWLL